MGIAQQILRVLYEVEEAGESEHPYWGAASDYWCEEWPG
jgi:hypothetical protein